MGKGRQGVGAYWQFYLFTWQASVSVWEDDGRIVEDKYPGEALSRLTLCGHYPPLPTSVTRCWSSIQNTYLKTLNPVFPQLKLLPCLFSKQKLQRWRISISYKCSFGLSIRPHESQMPSYSLLMGKHNHKLTLQLTLVVQPSVYTV